MTDILTTQALTGLLTLTVLEIVLGIDNIIFVSILASRLPAGEEKRGRTIGLMLGMVIRILMLLGINWVISQSKPLFRVLEIEISGKDMMLIVGGLFLLYQSVHEIHLKLKGIAAEQEERTSFKGVYAIYFQMLLLNVVFSLDSVITAVGMSNQVWVMIAAVVISMGVMLFAASPIANFVTAHPSIKILALSFLIMIGISLIAEGLDQHFNKGYIYFGMAFSFIVELMNLRLDKLSGKTEK